MYTCVTAGYDKVTAVPDNWDCDFILFHDGSISVPAGWQERRLEISGCSGPDLNRYAKMRPHRLELPSDVSMYVDGNVVFKSDPMPFLRDVASTAAVSAYPHPSRDCPYSEIRETLRLGFIGPGAAWKPAWLLRQAGVPRHAGLFEAGVMVRRHYDPKSIALGEAWWLLWQGGLRRDQPLLSAAAWQSGTRIQPIGANNIHDDTNPFLVLATHAKGRPRIKRLPNRLAAELSLFRLWLRQ